MDAGRQVTTKKWVQKRLTFLQLSTTFTRYYAPDSLEFRLTIVVKFSSSSSPFSVVKTEKSGGGFLTRNPVRLTKTIQADGEKVEVYVDEEVRSRETKHVTNVTNA